MKIIIYLNIDDFSPQINFNVWMFSLIFTFIYKKKALNLVVVWVTYFSTVHHFYLCEDEYSETYADSMKPRF